VSLTCPKCGKVGRSRGGMVTHIRFCGRDYEPVFWSRVDKNGPGGCWLWTGALQRDGYAHFHYRKTISSHRYAYEKLVGPIPEGMDLLHSCDVRHCVNPAHLRPGTHEENMLEAKAKRRHSWGERARHKLTAAQVAEIRRKYQRRMIGKRTTWSNVKELAAEYGVNAGTGW